MKYNFSGTCYKNKKADKTHPTQIYRHVTVAQGTGCKVIKQIKNIQDETNTYINKKFD